MMHRSRDATMRFRTAASSAVRLPYLLTVPEVLQQSTMPIGFHISYCYRAGLH